MPKNWLVQGWQSYQPDARLDFQAAFIDMHLDNSGEAKGISVIRKLREKQPHMELVAISGDLDRDIMEDCLKNGASRYLAKPLSPEELTATIEKIEALVLLRDAGQRQSQKEVTWIGDSAEAERIKQTIASLRGEPGPILLSGESGTGKEVVARILNDQEPDRPFVAFNVAAISENLFESEMFGHVKGAFSGAEQNKMGLAEAAHGGDLFLDEIEALPIKLQVKLLRFLETFEVRRVGASNNVKVDVRIIAATNRNLKSMVEKEEFREDLLYRLAGKNINLPPLRNRLSDIPALASFFIAAERPKRNKSFEPEALTQMRKYAWPGNIRELKRVVEQLSLISPLPIIRQVDVVKVLGINESPSNSETINFDQGLNSLLVNYEARVIQKCLQSHEDVGEAANILQVSKSNLYKKMKDYNISAKQLPTKAGK